jgi:hypothetical protein
MFSCGSVGFQKIEEAIENAAIAAEEIANQTALKQYTPGEDELSVERKVSAIAGESFEHIKEQLQKNKDLDSLTLQMIMPNIRIITTSFLAPFPESLRNILKTGLLSEGAQASITLINSLVPPEEQ